MKNLTLLLSICIIAMLSSTAFAVPKGKTLIFNKAAMGSVTFDGTLHNNHAKGCRQCHNPQVFPKMKHGTVQITMKKIYAGAQCGICHNGNAAFKAKGNCKRCHHK